MPRICCTVVVAMLAMAPPQQRVALVTPSSRGLGRAIAERLARDGPSVAVNGLHDDRRASEVVDGIRRREQGCARLRPCRAAFSRVR
jgi:NAD(P)-dependent dehydrogenase (short-subunit alcohol dehydrogenase family)